MQDANFTRDMLATLQQVHGVGDMPTGAVALLVSRLESLKKPTDDITLGEVRRELCAAQSQWQEREK
ncbi:hypothetical protein [Thioalkalivibrio sp. ARh3]|uniref:hypothetical protein n=1 Tax=Thioalkalivibrio sp. ARh3 TaxID=1158148 RepID=UPI00037151DF|nr:hypothetical protein [Thioalkalivibrio sp. ARh3]